MHLWFISTAHWLELRSMATLSQLQGRQESAAFAWEPCVFQTHSRRVWILLMIINPGTGLMVKQVLVNGGVFYILQDLVVVVHPKNLLKYLSCRRSKEELDTSGEFLRKVASLISRNPQGGICFGGSQPTSQFIRLKCCPDSGRRPISVRQTYQKQRQTYQKQRLIGKV